MPFCSSTLRHNWLVEVIWWQSLRQVQHRYICEQSTLLLGVASVGVNLAIHAATVHHILRHNHWLRHFILAEYFGQVLNAAVVSPLEEIQPLRSNQLQLAQLVGRRQIFELCHGMLHGFSQCPDFPMPVQRASARCLQLSSSGLLDFWILFLSDESDVSDVSAEANPH